MIIDVTIHLPAVTFQSKQISELDTIRYDTIEEINVDSKAEYTA